MAFHHFAEIGLIVQLFKAKDLSKINTLVFLPEVVWSPTTFIPVKLPKPLYRCVAITTTTGIMNIKPITIEMSHRKPTPIWICTNLQDTFPEKIDALLDNEQQAFH